MNPSSRLVSEGTKYQRTLSSTVLRNVFTRLQWNPLPLVLVVLLTCLESSQMRIEEDSQLDLIRFHPLGQPNWKIKFR